VADFLGSVRIPSAFCGLYGLRPSYGRVPYSGTANSLEGQDSILSVLGPLSASLGGVKVFMKAILAQKPWLKDPLVVRKKWDEDEYQLVDHGEGNKMCFGILWDDGGIVPHPPIIRGLEMAKDALIAAGHYGLSNVATPCIVPLIKYFVVVDWKPLKHNELFAVAVSVFENSWIVATRTEDMSRSSKTSGAQVQPKTIRLSQPLQENQY
jgi:Asp-tRNA(Asn)/Glu-tRNA(Gln) amidotransferase A subunit family amidase